MRKGVLPKQMLRELFDTGFISGIKKDTFENNYLNPASIDLPLSDEAYRLKDAFSGRADCSVRSLLKREGAIEHDLRQPLEVGVSYLIRVAGQWKLPSHVYGYVNPKSSAGRVFGIFRVMADNVAMYDALVGPGWEGEMWVLARADAFPLKVAPGIAVSQLRLFDGPSFLDPLEAELVITRHGLLFDSEKKRIIRPHEHKDSFFLTLDVYGKGWECRGTNEPLDMSKVGFYDPAEFFEPVVPRNGALKLRKGSSYILSTKERVMVPPELSAELRAVDPRFGEFRSHFAGYIDPGWGYGTDGSACGRPITLELTLHENRVAHEGESVVRIRYEWMKEPPETAYDAAKSNYTGQESATLAKFFKKP